MLRVGIDARLVPRGLGVSVAIRGLVSALVGKVEVIWFGEPTAAPDGVADVVPVSGFYPVLDSALGRRAVARHDLDCFHFAANTGWVRRGPVPVVLTVHDLIYMRTSARARSLRQIVGHRYARTNVRRAVRTASAIVTPTRAVADDMRCNLRPAVEPIVIPWGTDQSIARVEPRINGTRYVVAFASHDPRKGTRLAFDAWRAMSDEGLELWLLAGGGMPRGFERHARRELESARVKVFGYLPTDAMQRILRGARALVYPSTAEGFGLPVLEAMASGVPVVTGLAPATLEVGGSGICPIDPVDPVGSIRQTLARLEKNGNLRAELVAHARARARTFTWEAAADAYAAAYRSAAADAPSGGAC